MSHIRKTASAILPTLYGTYQLIVYQSADGLEHAVLLMENDFNKKRPILVRIHSQCLTGDTFLSLKCDCREQLHQSMKLIQQKGHGIIIYLNQEGRGIGLNNKIRAYALQDSGLDTVEANKKIGLGADLRDYKVAAQILKSLKISKISLLTNNPDKENQIKRYGITVINCIPLEVTPNPTNKNYLQTKKDKLGHKLSLV